jgi:tetratricopeptide (TPR) repeat protein
LPLHAQDADCLYAIYSKAKGAEQVRTANEICALAFRREVVNEEWAFSPDDDVEQIRARTLYCMSSFAAAKGDYQKAITYIEEGLSIDERLNNMPMVACDYRKLATIYDRINQIDKAISCFDKSIDISSSVGDEKNEAETLFQLGMFYLRKNRNEAGIQTVEKVLSMARKINLSTVQTKSHKNSKKIMEDILLIKSSIIQTNSVNQDRLFIHHLFSGIIGNFISRLLRFTSFQAIHLFFRAVKF